jgi:hypothetical protein
MTVRQDPLQYYPLKITSEPCTVKRKQEPFVRAGEQQFTAEASERAEKRKRVNIWLLQGPLAGFKE